MKYLRNSRHYPDGLPAVGLLFLRIFMGYALAQYGLGKIQNPLGWMGPQSSVPGVLQALAAVSEFFGGIALIFGAIFPLACFGIMCTMFVATMVNVGKGEMLFGAAAKGGDSSESSALYFVIALALFFIGPGLLSFDYFMFGRKKSAPIAP